MHEPGNVEWSSRVIPLLVLAENDTIFFSDSVLRIHSDFLFGGRDTADIATPPRRSIFVLM